MEARHVAFVLDVSEFQALASVANRLRLSSEERATAENLAEALLSFVSRLEESRSLRRVFGRPLLAQALSLAVESDIALIDAVPALQSILTDSVLVFAAPHLALPFELMQSRIPQFQFELLS